MERGAAGEQASLFDFDGDTYERQYDQLRLNDQLRRVAVAMRDERWRTLAEIASLTGDPEASISARLRDFRKDRFGRHTVNGRRRAEGGGLWEYQMLWRHS